MSHDNGAGGSPTGGTGPITLPLLPFTVGFAALGALFFAYRWATPRDGESLGWFLVDLLVITLLASAYLIQLTRFGVLRWAVPVLPFWVVGVVRSATVFVAGGWVGGWALGVAGAVVGALAGLMAGWLFTRWVIPPGVMATAGKLNIADNRAESGAAANRPPE